jgi:methylaspartate ammonia-lyase
MKILDLVAVPGLTGFYADDQAAILAGAGHDGFDYVGAPMTLGFKSIREPGQSLSVLLLLDTGEVAHGDCAVVQYSGAGGREPLFNSEEAQNLIERSVAPLLRGRTINDFRSIAQEMDHLVVDGKRLPAAIRYGLTQAPWRKSFRMNMKLVFRSKLFPCILNLEMSGTPTSIK